MAKVTHDVMRWVDDRLAQEPALRERVEARLGELRIEQELIALREARGLTQAQVAKLLRVSQPAVAKIESGSENLTLRTVLRMVTALGGAIKLQVLKPRAAKVVGIRARRAVESNGPLVQNRSGSSTLTHCRRKATGDRRGPSAYNPPSG